MTPDEVAAAVEEATVAAEEPDLEEIDRAGADSSAHDATTIVPSVATDSTVVDGTPTDRPKAERSVRRAKLGGPAAAELTSMEIE